MSGKKLIVHRTNQTNPLRYWAYDNNSLCGIKNLKPYEINNRYSATCDECNEIYFEAMRKILPQYGPIEGELCNCERVYDCCDCGGYQCGCAYCWSCNACENCL